MGNFTQGTNSSAIFRSCSASGAGATLGMWWEPSDTHPVGHASLNHRPGQPRATCTQFRVQSLGFMVIIGPAGSSSFRLEGFGGSGAQWHASSSSAGAPRRRPPCLLRLRTGSGKFGALRALLGGSCRGRGDEFAVSGWACRRSEHSAATRDQKQTCTINRCGHIEHAPKHCASCAAEGTEAVLSPKASTATVQCASRHAGQRQAESSTCPSRRLVATALGKSWLRDGPHWLLPGVDCAYQALLLSDLRCRQGPWIDHP